MLEYIFGYDILSADMAEGARIINICARLGLRYHQLSPDGESFRIRMGLAASARLRDFCARNGIRLCLLCRRGLPIALCELLGRGGILLGLLFCTVFICYTSSLLWDIRIEGNSHVPDSEIIEMLSECGVSVGAKKADIDADSAQNEFLIMSDKISWITVNIIGSVAEIEVRERTAAEPDADYLCSNLIATQNGKVLEFLRVRGNVAVKLGEAVSKGQLLVGGVYGDENSATRFVRASGQVMAMCKRDYEIEIPLDFDKKVYSGDKKIRKSFIFFEKEVKLFVNSGNLYTSCDIIEKEKYLELFGLGKLPFGVRTYEYVEYSTEGAKRSEAEAREQAICELWQRFASDSPEGVVASSEIKGALVGDVYRLVASVGSIENIAKEIEVKINITG